MKSVFKLIGGSLAIASCFGFGYYWRDVQRGAVALTSGRDLQLGIKTSPKNLSDEQIFKQNYARILSDYSRPIDKKNLKFSAMEGLVASLGDPHSNFFVPQVAKEFNEQTQGNFFGVGAKLGYDPLGCRVSTVFSDGPAFKAGLKEGDVITSVDGASMVGKATDYIVTKIKGEEGTLVKLGILRTGVQNMITLSIRRAQIIAPSVESKSFEAGKVGYLQVFQFSEPTAEQFDKEITKLEAGGMKGLVIDMRGNPGGLLNTASEMLSRYFDNKVVVTMKFRPELLAQDPSARRMESQKTFPGRVKDPGYPIVILINEDSASAAEIFSGVMQDYGRAKLLGDHSYGKASVQNVFPSRDGASVKLTVAKYYLPKGRFIGRTVDEDGAFLQGGIQPDVKVELDYNTEITLGEPKTDAQLAAAIKLVGG